MKFHSNSNSTLQVGYIMLPFQSLWLLTMHTTMNSKLFIGTLSAQFFSILVATKTADSSGHIFWLLNLNVHPPECHFLLIFLCNEHILVPGVSRIQRSIQITCPLAPVPSPHCEDLSYYAPTLWLVQPIPFFGFLQV